MEFLTTVLVPLLVSVASVFIALRLLPYDLQNKKSDTIAKLYGTVEKLVKDLEVANQKAEKQAEQIEWLENRNDLTLKTQIHIRLTNPPMVESNTVEYIIQDKITAV